LVIVPSQPRDVTAKLVNDDIVVTWEEPQDHNGILKAYWVSKEHTNKEFDPKLKETEQIYVNCQAAMGIAPLTAYTNCP